MQRLAKWRKGWEGLQVSRSGKYSVQRLEALDAYCRRASLLRVFLVCLATPLPPLLFVLVIETIPLENPEKGWHANYVMWIRGAIMTVVMSQAFIVEGSAVIPELRMTWREAFAISAVPSVVNTGFLVAVAAAWVYPIPFMNVLFGFPFMVSLTCAVVIWVRMNPNRHQVPDFRSRARTFLLVFSTQSVMGILYPVYSAIYSKLDGFEQLCFTMLLFPMKKVMKNLMARACKSLMLADFVPEITNFTVELFHSLYLLSSVKSGAVSVEMTLVIMAAEVATSLLAIHRIRTQKAKIRGCAHHVDIVSACIALTRPRTTAATKPTNAQPCVAAPPDKGKRVSLGKSSSQVVPVEVRAGEIATECSFSSAKRCKLSAADMSDAMLRILFTSEFLVLSEYVGCIIPLQFAIYTQALYHLPNAKYYPDLKGISASAHNTTVQRSLWLHALNLAVLVGVCGLLKWRLKLPGVYQLAFVLETQFARIQTKMLCYLPFCLFFQIEHYGENAHLRRGECSCGSLTTCAWSSLLQASTSASSSNGSSEST